jgi:hypothetical protein
LGSTGILVYRILQILGYEKTFLPLIAAVLIVINGADAAISFVPMLIVRQSIFFTIFALFLLLKYKETEKNYYLFVASAFQICSLWTYEATFPVLIYFGLLFLQCKKKSRVLIWLVPQFLFTAQITVRYLLNNENSYQRSRIVIEGLDRLVIKLTNLIVENFNFFAWPIKWYEKYFDSCLPLFFYNIKYPLSLCVLIVSILSFFIARRLSRNFVFKKSLLLHLLVLMLLAYLPFIFLNNLENSGINYLNHTFRAHFLASIPVSIILSIALMVANNRFGKIIFALSFGCVFLMGSISGILAQFENAKIAEGSKYIQRSIVEVAPSIRDGTLIVLINLPDHGLKSFCTHDDFNPYGDSMWFNSALKVLYPSTKLVATYFTGASSESSQSIVLKANSESFSLVSTPVTVDFNSATLDHVLIFDFKKLGSKEFLLNSIDSKTITGLNNYDQYKPEINKTVKENYSPSSFENIKNKFIY